MRALVTGANRGIGLELVTQLVGRGAIVFAACRQPELAADLFNLQTRFPDRVKPVTLDVADEGSIRESIMEVAAQTDSLDLLINNAAVIGSEGGLQDLTMPELIATFRVNAFGPILMAKYYLDLLRRGNTPMLVSISSEYGSLSDKRDGDLYDYCASKAALNMFTRTFNFDAARLGITAFIVDPGWVRTRMSGWDGDLSAAESADGILQVINGARANPPHYAGRYLRWNGDEMPW